MVIVLQKHKDPKTVKALHRWSDNFENNSANGYFLLIL